MKTARFWYATPLLFVAAVAGYLLWRAQPRDVVVSNSVSDKRRDIAIMRSMGFSEADLQLVFVIEGMMLALVGVFLGWLLGYGLMEILGSLKFPIAGVDEHLPLDRRPRQYAIAAAASLVTGAIAVWLPARKAAHVDPVDILRGAA